MQKIFPPRSPQNAPRRQSFHPGAKTRCLEQAHKDLKKHPDINWPSDLHVHGENEMHNDPDKSSRCIEMHPICRELKLQTDPGTCRPSKFRETETHIKYQNIRDTNIIPVGRRHTNICAIFVWSRYTLSTVTDCLPSNLCPTVKLHKIVCTQFCDNSFAYLHCDLSYVLSAKWNQCRICVWFVSLSNNAESVHHSADLSNLSVWISMFSCVLTIKNL